MGRCPMFVLLAALIAMILISDSTGLRKPMEPPFYGHGRYCARILEIKEAQTSGRIAMAEVDSVNGRACYPFRLRVHFLGEKPYLTAGMCVWFAGRVDTLAAPPAVPDAIDLLAAMRRKGVVGSAVIVEDSICATGHTPGVRSWLLRANDEAMTRLKRCPLETGTIDMLAAMLLGKGDMLTADTRTLYSAAGLSHLLALSGMHAGIIAMIVAFALFPLYLTQHVRTRLILTALILWVYAAFTDFAPSVTRAVLMASVYMGARCLERSSQPLNSLCLAVAAILLFNPSALYSPGLQMSAAAVLGIILFYPHINLIDRRRRPFLYRLLSYPWLSFSAMIFTAPVAAFHFHTFPVFFIVANLLVAPLLPLFLVSGIISIIFSVGGPTDFLANCIDLIARLTASLPGAVMADVYPDPWLVAAVCALMLALGIALNARNLFASLESLLLLIIVCAVAWVAPPKRYPAHEEYLIETPRGNHLLVRDGGTCTLLTPLRAAREREDLREHYAMVLRDFMAKRGVDTFTVEPDSRIVSN